MKKDWYVGEDAKLVEAMLDKYRGSSPNPLNGLTFKEILALAKKMEETK